MKSLINGHLKWHEINKKADIVTHQYSKCSNGGLHMCKNHQGRLKKKIQRKKGWMRAIEVNYSDMDGYAVNIYKCP